MGAHGPQALPENLLHGLLFMGCNPCQELAPADLHVLQLPSWHVHLQWRRVLHRLQRVCVVWCRPPWAAGKYLFHHVLHGPQRKHYPSTWSTSSSPRLTLVLTELFLTHIFHSSLSQSAAQCLLPFSKCFFRGTSITAVELSSAFCWVCWNQLDQPCLASGIFSLLSQRPALQPPCRHLGT